MPHPACLPLQLIEDLRKQLEHLQLFKLEAEQRRGRSSSLGLQEYNSRTRETELEQEIRRLKQVRGRPAAPLRRHQVAQERQGRGHLLAASPCVVIGLYHFKGAPPSSGRSEASEPPWTVAGRKGLFGRLPPHLELSCIQLVAGSWERTRKQREKGTTTALY